MCGHRGGKAGPRPRRAAPGVGLAVLLALTGLPALPAPAAAIELCSPEARGMMAQAGIARAKVERLCKMAARGSALLTLSLKRKENELGYCMVTLALHNNSIRYLNQMALVSADSRFDIFRFDNVLPGETGYASARSRILLGCDELREVGIRFRWPAGIRIGDRSPRGKRLERFKPLLLDKAMRWAG